MCFYGTVSEPPLINVTDNSCQGPGISESRHVGSYELVPNYLQSCENQLNNILSSNSASPSQGFRLSNGHTLMLFKDIFDIYQSISNKVVGILARARKNRLIHFEGETLFQGENDATNITLLRSAKHIEVRSPSYTQTGLMDFHLLFRIISGTRRNYFTMMKPRDYM